MDDKTLIRSWREAKGLSQQQMADLIGVSYVTISRWETGKSKPYADNLNAIANKFGISFEQFMLGPQRAVDVTKIFNDGIIKHLNEHANRLGLSKEDLILNLILYFFWNEGHLPDNMNDVRGTYNAMQANPETPAISDGYKRLGLKVFPFLKAKKND